MHTLLSDNWDFIKKYSKYFIFVKIVIFVFALLITNLEIEKAVGSNQKIVISSPSALFFLDRWDISRYIQIAKDGYVDVGGKLSSYDPTQYTNIGFFPLNSVFASGFSKVFGLSNSYTGIHLIGILLANLYAFLSGIILYLISRKYYSNETSFYVALSTLILPVSFFLSVPYAESLLLLMTLLSIYFAEKDEWHYAVLFGIGAALTKSYAVLIVIPLLTIVIRGALKGAKGAKDAKGTKRKIFFSFLPLTGTALYAVFSYYLTGDFLAYVHVQNGAWQHHWAEPITFLIKSLFVDTSNMLSALYCILCIAVILIFWKKIPLPFSLYSIALLLFTPLTGYTVGLIRYSVGAIALYYVVAYYLESFMDRGDKSDKSDKGDKNSHHKFVIFILVFAQAVFLSLWLRDFWILS